VSKRSMRRNDRPKDDRQRPQPRSCWFARTLVLVLLRRCRSSYRVGVKSGMDRFVADLSPTDLSTPFTRVFGIRATGLAYNLANSLRQLGLPRSIRRWNLTTLREKLVNIGAKVVRHAKYVIFQLAEVAVPRRMFAVILERIGRLRLACASR